MKIKVESGIPVPKRIAEASIYILKCPVDGSVKYVGKTVNLKRRYRGHIHGYTLRMAKWMSGLENKKLKPLMIEIEKVDYEDVNEREKYWIEYYEKEFGGLLNFTHNPSS